MTNTRAQGPLRGALIKASIILIVGLVTCVSAWQLRASAERNEHQFQLQMNQLRDEIERLRKDRQWTLTYQSSFQQLVEGGLIGNEKRLEWRALIIALGKELRVPDIQFDYQPKQNLPIEHLLQLGNHESLAVSAFASTMRVGASLLHSGDLLTLLYTLDHNRSAILMPQRCLMKLDRDPLYLRPEPLISTQCDLNWITLSIDPTWLADGG